MVPMLSNGTLMSYIDHSVQCRLKSNAPKIVTNHVIGTGQEKMSAGVGGPGIGMIPNFIFYKNKL